jgi:hypothetical protein
MPSRATITALIIVVFMMCPFSGVQFDALHMGPSWHRAVSLACPLLELLYQTVSALLRVFLIYKTIQTVIGYPPLN